MPHDHGIIINVIINVKNEDIIISRLRRSWIKEIV